MIIMKLLLWLYENNLYFQKPCLENLPSVKASPGNFKGKSASAR